MNQNEAPAAKAVEILELFMEFWQEAAIFIASTPPVVSRQGIQVPSLVAPFGSQPTAAEPSSVAATGDTLQKSNIAMENPLCIEVSIG